MDCSYGCFSHLRNCGNAYREEGWRLSGSRDLLISNCVFKWLRKLCVLHAITFSPSHAEIPIHPVRFLLPLFMSLPLPGMPLPAPPPSSFAYFLVVQSGQVFWEGRPPTYSSPTPSCLCFHSELSLPLLQRPRHSSGYRIASYLLSLD